MADYSSITVGYNTGTDASPTWTGTALAMSGTSGANELRMALSGATGSTTSANWPYMAKPTSGTQAVTQVWAFTTDGAGSQVATYTGDNTKANVFRYVFSADGNPVTAMQVGMFGDNTHTSPSAGTQPPVTHQDAFSNGQTSDTSSRGYLKANFFGSGFPAAGAQETPSAGSVGTNPSATTGTVGSVTTSAGAWLTTWQDLQGFTDYITAASIVKVSQAFNWYFTWVVFIGANITAGTWTPVQTLQYSYA